MPSSQPSSGSRSSRRRNWSRLLRVHLAVVDVVQVDAHDRTIESRAEMNFDSVVAAVQCRIEADRPADGLTVTRSSGPATNVHRHRRSPAVRRRRTRRKSPISMIEVARTGGQADKLSFRIPPQGFIGSPCAPQVVSTSLSIDAVTCSGQIGRICCRHALSSRAGWGSRRTYRPCRCCFHRTRFTASAVAGRSSGRPGAAVSQANGTLVSAPAARTPCGTRREYHRPRSLLRRARLLSPACGGRHLAVLAGHQAPHHEGDEDTDRTRGLQACRRLVVGLVRLRQALVRIEPHPHRHSTGKAHRVPLDGGLGCPAPSGMPGASADPMYHSPQSGSVAKKPA